MAIKVSFPNVKQPISDASGYITKAHYDFLRELWNRTGGNNDTISDIETDLSSAELLIFRNRIRELEKRVKDLETQLDTLAC